MFTVTKRLEVSASHQLKLDYPSKMSKSTWTLLDYYCPCSF